MPFHRKSTRLMKLTYLGTKAHFVTLICDLRRPYLQDPETAQLALSRLVTSAAHASFRLHAFCAMPDHLHFLAHGIEPVSDLLEFVRVFKQRTAFEFKKRTGRQLWAMSFYDHILRKADALEAVACYIWANPVRKNLCKRPEDFPYSGSLTIDWIKESRSQDLFTPPWSQPKPV